MTPFRTVATCTASLAAVLATAVMSTPHAGFNSGMRDAAITQAAEYCADRMAPSDPQYWYRWQAISTLDDDSASTAAYRTILISPFYRLRPQGLLIVRSIGGNDRVAMTIADLLWNKDITVVVRDLCFSACANPISIASDRTYLLRNAVVAWHGRPSGCPRAEIEAALVRWQLPCYSAAAVDDFFRRRGISESHMSSPQTHYTRSRFNIVLQSVVDKRSVFWMWHPKNHRDYFRGRLVHESYPASQENVDAIIRRFGLHVRVVYDPEGRHLSLPLSSLASPQFHST